MIPLHVHRNGVDRAVRDELEQLLRTDDVLHDPEIDELANETLWHMSRRQPRRKWRGSR